ncbi:uncharacterized protein LOC6567633 [Drosophila grimshawi]|uniref:GH18497 n=1 Tax=Drosophila grimshawi TaxID=7222 RepID=B4JSA3_DROGR|nr:uncharacterized protein LOC6567633 [Drosophila grimshawi]EDV94643.1 GH18497 [Drosophila grimshawi]
MDSTFGKVFLFLTDLAWKSRLTIPVLVTTAFLVMDIRLQIEINIETGQVNASDMEEAEAFEEHLIGGHDLDEESEYSDDLEDHSEYSNGDGGNTSNSSNSLRYSVDNYDDLGSEYDNEHDIEAYFVNDRHLASTLNLN